MTTAAKTNDVLFPIRVVGNATSADGRYRHRNNSTSSQSSSDLWFKTATILFPIFGVFILLSLIALAIKILRTDNSQSSPSKCDRGDASRLAVRAPGAAKGVDAATKATTVNVGMASDTNKSFNDFSCPQSLLPGDQRSDALSKIANSAKHKDDHYIRIPTYSTSEYHLIPQYFYEPLIDNSTSKSTVFIHSDRSVSKLSAAIFKALNHGGAHCDQQASLRAPLPVKNGII